MSDWSKIDVTAALQLLKTDSDHGLSEEEAARRLAEYGPNELTEAERRSPWLILWEQLTSVLVLILIAASVLSAVVSDYKDSIVIIVVVLLFAILGFIQDYRADRAMAALKKLAVPFVRVRRDCEVRETSARSLVPGDILLVEAGNVVPADCRLVECFNLRAEEAALTGESVPVDKSSQVLERDNPALGDRHNMLFMGTVLAAGRGLALVVETGMRTELGRIAAMIQSVGSEQTPLQVRLDQLGKALGVVALAVAGLIFGLGVLRGEDLTLMLMTAVSVAVAAVPEGLPAIVTVTLALGAQRMLKRHALIRKLPAVETLGSVTVICSDKTGTLTENRMTVTVIDIAGHRFDFSEQVSPDSLQPPGDDQRQQGTIPTIPFDPALSLLLAGMTLCNDALVKPDGKEGELQTLGDPTEVALVVAAVRVGLWKEKLEAALPRISELPFDSERKRMTTVHRVSREFVLAHEGLEMIWDGNLGIGVSPYIAFVKGAVDGVLQLSSHVVVEGRAEPLTIERHKQIANANDELAGNGMRVLGVAARPLASAPVNGQHQELERELIFLGLVGMIDPPRVEVKNAVQICKTAGIRPVMITGDHPLTATYIARALGIESHGSALTGQDLDQLSGEQLRQVVDDVSVFARVSPEHKLKLVEALKDRGHVVAMTGDGVNDAPALKKADIGVAMGITGTDVAKEAAGMVLLDDNFATIVAAVEEGRVIYDNIRKYIKYSIAGNIGKILVVLVGPLLGMPLTLLPLQLLWLNLLTDGLLGLGLGVEKAESSVMQRPPYQPSESIFARGMGRHIIWLGSVIGLLSLGVGYWYWQSGDSHWQTMTFTTLAFLQIGQALAVRSSRDSLFRIGIASNPLLLAMALLTFALQIAVIYIRPLQSVFGTQALPQTDLAISLGLGSVVFFMIEIEKWVMKRTPFRSLNEVLGKS